MRSILVVDVDHTIADAAWRDHLMPEVHETGDWSEYYRCQDLDEPIQHMVNFIKTMACSMDVVICTAREEKYRAETEDWLMRHHVPFSELLMRPPGDKSPTPALKVAMIESLERQVAFVIDDRDDVLRAFAARGFPVLPAGAIA